MVEQAVAEAPDTGVKSGHHGGVERSDAEAVNKKETRSLYQKRIKIYPKMVKGAFRRWKWVIMALTLGVYYLTPWIRWDRGANAPDQAVLIDFPGRRFYFFFIEIWPQEVYYLTGLLILAAIGLFLITSLAGRVWCGYTCPQTVWTDLFIAVEKIFQGDRAARIRLDKAPWGATKIFRKAGTQVAWVIIAICTGGAWVFYFADAPALMGDLLAFQAPPVSYITIGVLAFTTYLLGGFAREQVCTYMCPWPRIQGGLLDEESLVITYNEDRGEPRGARKKDTHPDNLGDCVACNQCVAVCPMGIDIRDGQQLECITCGLCIDACNTVMDKVGLPRNLIEYSTLANVERVRAGEKPRLRLIRPRTLVYSGLIVLVGVIMLFSLITRADLDLSILRDRNPLFVTLSDGSIRNGYTVKIINKQHRERTFRLEIEGLPGAALAVVGSGVTAEALVVGPDNLASYRVFATVPQAALQDSATDVRFRIVDREGGETTNNSVFRGPQ
ncbi:cytochrome c oxidase accessory protein CcoG [Pelagibius litoralis]|uniref:Cytochrome c oxidase accessory protein CcoG n=1 Tax=Pelagibius litoralis TaxID=374515 RepID=A0A967C7Q1_9PROT|nr:cytochrome c oxidase accessory protein CcoG [Pelagibius litoralis]NIA69176.1 cytochrome c oxidase accessory protein CcoG [Pelagibius litoralis]